jgi:ParB/RepB/Spo0J family partition protein
MIVQHIAEFPLSRLVLSPTNPETRYAAAEIEDLAEKIRAAKDAEHPRGQILQSLLVRPHPESTDGEGDELYEVVCGNRRKLAGELAGVDAAPVLVREMSDEDARQAQELENAGRRDFTPLEEADRYAGWQKLFGLAVADIAVSGLWDETHRERGLAIDKALVVRCDEVWLCGGRVSPGMREEARTAVAFGLPVFDLTYLGDEPPACLIAGHVPTWRGEEATP